MNGKIIQTSHQEKNWKHIHKWDTLRKLNNPILQRNNKSMSLITDVNKDPANSRLNKNC